MNLDAYETINNPDKKRFELEIDGVLSVIEYTFKKSTNQMFLVHTEVDPSLRGKGVASKIVKEALDIIRKEGHELVPLCPFVVAFLKKHKEYHDLMNEKNQARFK
ncbi:GNAT family N-acetyltransferase [Imperialibacter roseus]|uniref:GNAT family N-acetyltransferase n=1 Tax=Imperialibacter roseus TaxID=1324217 RepID=A0ABZ0ISJ6_9BACT|nr:GNAT family N-acetyltransferase [Imperialibacter roseus]WOK08012.1 GNAT family N-acetyltransferase [Imperialibacter roseus]|tara:strand:- start:26412 stop:26726 length:315 start_codon:yes stop_codon:yes gene_type:complete